MLLEKEEKVPDAWDLANHQVQQRFDMEQRAGLPFPGNQRRLGQWNLASLRPIAIRLGNDPRRLQLKHFSLYLFLQTDPSLQLQKFRKRRSWANTRLTMQKEAVTCPDQQISNVMALFAGDQADLTPSEERHCW